MLPYFIDSHCHLDFSKFNRDREEVIHRAKEAGACEMINSGIDLKTNISTLELAKTHDCIHPTIGLSPMLATNPDKDRPQEVLSQLDEQAGQAIGIGEAGVDYYHCTDEKLRKRQRDIFEQVISIAEKHTKPLVIHGRDAEEEALAMAGHLDRVIFHCYGGSLETMKKITDAGHYISIPTLVCFSSHHKEIAATVPEELMLIETDSPYLSPRKGRNEPAYLIDSINTIAEKRNMEPADVAEITRKNTYTAFKI
ncbi:TatD family deoxyribonuclease [Methanohalophilus sp. RSK]|uniref:TatD family hydrolase n=1 Tax=Methanohalophilus sp. RSK TaxID=2485783 RepID=UPI000F43B573|nr:TatD family hydrolase [Methanohalophilus sp. RSK]RNI15297.1 TatD family deoxyribonuclease [Methanohalophilus sp. RSK]